MLAGTISMIPTSDGRVDFVCAEGAREKLQARLNDQIDKEFNQKETQITAEIDVLISQRTALKDEKTDALNLSRDFFN